MNDIMERFREITRYDISVFFSDFVTFINSDYQNFIDYYSGEAEINRDSISRLNNLREQVTIINDLFTIHSKDLSGTAEFWDLITNFDEVKIKLETVFKTSKWLRSNVTSGVYEPNVNFTKVLKQNETLEDVTEFLGFNDPQNNWSELAIKNDLNEEKYTPEGGVVLSASLQNNASVNIRTVIDNIVGKRIYGFDIQNKLEYEDDDLKILNNDETIQQAFDTLIGLTRGSVPEFRNDGVDKRAFAGSNANSIGYPAVFRQLLAVFQKDDTFRAISILNVDQRNDFMSVQVSAETRLGETLTGELVI